MKEKLRAIIPVSIVMPLHSGGSGEPASATVLGVVILSCAAYFMWAGFWIWWGTRDFDDSRFSFSIFMTMVFPMIVGGLLLIFI